MRFPCSPSVPVPTASLLCRSCLCRFCCRCLKDGSPDDLTAWLPPPQLPRENGPITHTPDTGSAACPEASNKHKHPECEPRQELSDEQKTIETMLGRQTARLYERNVLNYCPTCCTAFLKEGGCNMLTCRNCKTLFCGNCNENITKTGSGHFEMGSCNMRLLDLDVSFSLSPEQATEYRLRVGRGEDVEAVLQHFNTDILTVLRGHRHPFDGGEVEARLPPNAWTSWEPPNAWNSWESTLVPWDPPLLPPPLVSQGMSTGTTGTPLAAVTPTETPTSSPFLWGAAQFDARGSLPQSQWGNAATTTAPQRPNPRGRYTNGSIVSLKDFVQRSNQR